MNACPQLAATFMSQLMEIVIPLLATALTGMLGYATLKFKEWVDSKTLATRQATINQAVQGGLGKAEEDALRAKIAGLSEPTREEKAASATAYVEKHVPDALAADKTINVPDIVVARMAGKPNVAEPLPVAPVIVPAPV